MLINTAKQTNTKQTNEFASVTGWARRLDALGSGHCEGLPMGETCDRSPEGQRGSRVRIREGRGVPREQKSESPWGEKGSPEGLGYGQKLEGGGERAGRTVGVF